MAKVLAQVLGGTIQKIEGVCTLGELKRRLDATGYQATVNDDPINDDTYPLNDNEFVALAPAVKGGDQ